MYKRQIHDHINLMGANPLIGENPPMGESGDGRFVDMSRAYDGDLADRFRAAARRLDIALADGIYMWFSGPSFETPAEIRAARVLGADAVGMSTVPEAIIARYLGMRVAAVCNITNLASGLTAAPLSPPPLLKGESFRCPLNRRERRFELLICQSAFPIKNCTF